MIMLNKIKQNFHLPSLYELQTIKHVIVVISFIFCSQFTMMPMYLDFNVQQYYNLLFMTEKNQPKSSYNRISKLNLQSISIFNYYLKILFPKLFKAQIYPPKDFTRIKGTDRNIIYNYSFQKITGIQGLNDKSIIQAAMFVYFSTHCSKLRQNSIMKSTTVKLPYLPVWKEINQQIDIFVIEDQNKTLESQRNIFRSPHKNQLNIADQLRRKRSHPLISVAKNQKEDKANEQYSLYVVHYKNTTASDNEFNWENFIEKYTFKSQQNEGENNYFIIYQTVYSYNGQSSLLSFNHNHKILQSFYEMNIFTEKHPYKFLMLQKITNKLRSLVQMNKIKTNMQSQSPSFDIQHRRQLSLNPEQKIVFNDLKVKTLTYFATINRKKEINRYFLQNLICRMMSSQSYKQGQSWEAIKYYLQFEKRIRDKYRWSSFLKYDKMNIFTYIGKDMMGRPILLNRMRNTLCSKITNFDQFFDYHMYLFEIYMQDQMQGWVDQFFVIADGSNQVADNTNIGFTKRLLSQQYKVSIGRPFKIVAFDISFLGTALYRVLKPLLPENLINCVKLIGDDREELLDQLRKQVSDEVIPQFLGGKNPTLETKIPQQEAQQKGYTQLTTDRSMLRSVKSAKNLRF